MKVQITSTAGGLRERSSLCIELRAISYTYYCSLLACMHVYIITTILFVEKQHLKFTSSLSWMKAAPERLIHEEWPHCLRDISQHIFGSFRVFFHIHLQLRRVPFKSQCLFYSVSKPLRCMLEAWEVSRFRITKDLQKLHKIESGPLWNIIYCFSNT